MTDSQVNYGDHAIHFSVRYLAGLTGKVRIHVQPDLRVTVDAPSQTAMPEIKAAVLKRARWVRKQLGILEHAHAHALPRQYVSGETHWYLGKRYLLKLRGLGVNGSTRRQPAVRLVRGMLEVRVPNFETCPSDAISNALGAWYKEKARAVFARRVDEIWPRLAWVKAHPDWQIRPMTKQWGSCSPNGRLSLNPMLVKAPRSCIDYVIIHELCHLRHHNHGKAFYRLLGQQLPSWQETKQRLDGLAELILS